MHRPICWLAAAPVAQVAGRSSIRPYRISSISIKKKEATPYWRLHTRLVLGKSTLLLFVMKHVFDEA